jgi:hypothetical protein
MAMSSTQLKGVKVDKGRKSIIKKYKIGIGIQIIAAEYNIAVDTLCRRLKKWGVKIKKGDFKRKANQKQEHFRMKISPELLAQRSINQKVNNEKIHFIKGVDISGKRNLYRKFLDRAYL